MKLQKVEVHIGCNGKCHGLPPDGVSYCEDCEIIVEGETEFITDEEWGKKECSMK